MIPLCNVDGVPSVLFTRVSASGVIEVSDSFMSDSFIHRSMRLPSLHAMIAGVTTMCHCHDCDTCAHIASTAVVNSHSD